MLLFSSSLHLQAHFSSSTKTLEKCCEDDDDHQSKGSDPPCKRCRESSFCPMPLYDFIREEGKKDRAGLVLNSKDSLHSLFVNNVYIYSQPIKFTQFSFHLRSSKLCFNTLSLSLNKNVDFDLFVPYLSNWSLMSVHFAQFSLFKLFLLNLFL